MIPGKSGPGNSDPGAAFDGTTSQPISPPVETDGNVDEVRNALLIRHGEVLKPGYWKGKEAAAVPVSVEADAAAVQLDQQYVEVLHTGGENKLNLNAIHLEVVNSGEMQQLQENQINIEVLHSGENNILQENGIYIEIITDYGPY